MKPQRILVKSIGGSLVTSGIVRYGLTEGTLRVDCQNGMSINIPQVITKLQPNDNCTIVLGAISHVIVNETGEIVQ
jgi:hypothetical protein